MSKILSLFFLVITTHYCFAQSNIVSIGAVNRTSIPTTIYASTEYPINLVRITGLDLNNENKGVHFSIYADLVSPNCCDSIIIISSNKTETILKNFECYFTQHSFGSLSEFSIDYFVDAIQTRKLEQTTIEAMTFYIGEKNYKITLTQDKAGYLKSYLCGCK